MLAEESRGRGTASEKRQWLLRATLGQGEWGFHGGSRHAPTQPGEYMCSEMSPCGQATSAGACVSWRWGEPPGNAPLLLHERLPPQAPSCHRRRLPAVPGA